MNGEVELLERLEAQGVSVSLEGDQLRIKSTRPITPDVVEQVASQKQGLIAFLSERIGAERRARVPCAEWERLRRLGPLLGRAVELDGRSVLLWGLSPRGALVDTGVVILNVDPRDLCGERQ